MSGDYQLESGWHYKHIWENRNKDRRKTLHVSLQPKNWWAIVEFTSTIVVSLLCCCCCCFMLYFFLFLRGTLARSFLIVIRGKFVSFCLVGVENENFVSSLLMLRGGSADEYPTSTSQYNHKVTLFLSTFRQDNLVTLS
jgi:hypothetical protein